MPNFFSRVFFFLIVYVDKNTEPPVPQKRNESLKFLRRHVSINSDGGISKRITSSETLQHMILYDLDKWPNNVSTAYDNGEEDNVSYSDSSRNSIDRLAIEQPMRIVTTPYNHPKNNTSQEQMIPSTNCADNKEYKEEQSEMIRLEHSPYIRNKKINEDDETELGLSSSSSLPILMNAEEPYRKTWVPYFTGLTTVIILIYFIISIVYNAVLTGKNNLSLININLIYIFILGHVIQVSPFNQMIGPAPEVSAYM